ncbi:MAG: DUF4105 domain-containing protein [Myxococcales bacterium]|nr:DUF4105 domain-containing protein [Myxococcales bacterium]
MLIAAAFAASAARADGYLPELQASAREQRLAEERGWIGLVHYERGLFGGWHSEASSSFFLSPRGADDPAGELDATLASFFSADGQCRFPARMAWLNSRLHFDFARLPLASCPKFEEFFGKIGARSITMVFSSYFLSSPASAFGHTLLRFDRTDGAEAGKHFELLDYGVNYSANVDTENALVYAVKGLLGVFPGQFSAIPYFYKVREYNDFESRDLWEYDLALTPQQVALVVAHIFELGATRFPYYYISRNCSYWLLAALEAAVPELDLLSHVGHVAVPADTVKALDSVPGLVRAVHYRPSIRSQFRRRAAELSGPELAQVAKLADEPWLTPVQRARVLDAELDLVDLRYGRGLLLGTDAPAMKLKQDLLERRSAVPVQSEELKPLPPLSQPDRGHGSMRVGLGGGGSTDTGEFAIFDFRLALHDLLDPVAGYPELAKLEFLPMRFRYNVRAQTLWLESAWLADVASVAPMDRFDQPLTWKMRAGALTLRDAGCNGCLAGAFETGGGASIAFFDDKLALLATGDATIVATPHLQGPSGWPARLGIGPSGAVRARLGDRLVMLGSAQWQYLPGAQPRSLFKLDASLRVALHGDLALSAELCRIPFATELTLGVFKYF